MSLTDADLDRLDALHEVDPWPCAQADIPEILRLARIGLLTEAAREWLPVSDAEVEWACDSYMEVSPEGVNTRGIRAVLEQFVAARKEDRT